MYRLLQPVPPQFRIDTGPFRKPAVGTFPNPARYRYIYIYLYAGSESLILKGPGATTCTSKQGSSVGRRARLPRPGLATSRPFKNAPRRNFDLARKKSNSDASQKTTRVPTETPPHSLGNELAGKPRGPTWPKIMGGGGVRAPANAGKRACGRPCWPDHECFGGDNHSQKWSGVGCLGGPPRDRVGEGSPRRVPRRAAGTDLPSPTSSILMGPGRNLIRTQHWPRRQPLDALRPTPAFWPSKLGASAAQNGQLLTGWRAARVGDGRPQRSPGRAARARPAVIRTRNCDGFGRGQMGFSTSQLGCFVGKRLRQLSLFGAVSPITDSGGSKSLSNGQVPAGLGPRSAIVWATAGPPSPASAVLEGVGRNSIGIGIGRADPASASCKRPSSSRSPAFRSLAPSWNRPSHWWIAPFKACTFCLSLPLTCGGCNIHAVVQVLQPNPRTQGRLFSAGTFGVCSRSRSNVVGRETQPARFLRT